MFGIGFSLQCDFRVARVWVGFQYPRSASGPKMLKLPHCWFSFGVSDVACSLEFSGSFSQAAATGA